MVLIQQCDKPNCSSEAEKTYKGKHGNKLYLCERHYYNFVASGEDSNSTNIADPYVRHPIDPCNFRNNIRNSTQSEDTPADSLKNLFEENYLDKDE